MSWDDVTIGSGEKMCSATKVFNLPGKVDISHNSVSYWISDVFLDLGMTVYKNTPEGIALTAMIKSTSVTGDELDHFLIQTMLKHMSVDKIGELVEAVKRYGAECRREGEETLAKQLRSLLRITNW